MDDCDNVDGCMTAFRWGCSPRRRDVRVRERHPHVELLGTVHVAGQRLLDAALERWPARDPPGSARRRAMRAVDHQNVRPVRLRSVCTLPLCPRQRRVLAAVSNGIWI